MTSSLLYKIVEDGKLILLDKPVGMTPYECVRQVKVGKYETTKIGYAGRLDPMASGLLVLLVGDENKKKHEYERLPKKYEVEMLFGITTDSLDLLGVVTETKHVDESFLLTQKTLKAFIGSLTMSYPIYSAKRVGGKSLYYHARSNNLSDIVIPTKQVTIHDIKIVESRSISKDEILSKVNDIIPLINGNFRQDEIVKMWNENFFGDGKTKLFPLVKISVDCESGTYMRWLVGEIGKSLEVPSLAYSIRRTQVGEYDINEISGSKS